VGGDEREREREREREGEAAKGEKGEEQTEKGAEKVSPPGRGRQPQLTAASERCGACPTVDFDSLSFPGVEMRDSDAGIPICFPGY
jgi:hypothetical protein